MRNTLRDLALFSNIVIGSVFFIWGWFGGADDGVSLARIGIGLGAVGLANVARAVYTLADKETDSA